MNSLWNDRGFFINFEWWDWSGKTTQFDLLSQRFNAVKLSSHISEEIKSIRWYIEELSRDNTDLRLSYYLMASIHDSEKAKKLLWIWKNVLTDRYIFSTLAYHRAMWSNFASSIELEKLDILRPDLTIYLDVDEKERFERLNLRWDLSATDKHLENDRELLNRVLLEYERMSSSMVRVDTTKKSIEEVFAEVLDNVNIVVWNIIRLNSGN